MEEEEEEEEEERGGVGCSDAGVQSSSQPGYTGEKTGRQPHWLMPFPHELFKVPQRRVRGSQTANY